MNSTLKSFIKITRPVNFLITFLSVIVAGAICVEGEYQVYKIFLAALSASLTLSAGNIINDIKDIEADKVNHPKRPLAAGNITIKQAKTEYVLLTLIALLLSVFINPPALVIAFAATVMLFLYSNNLKNILILNNLIVSILTGLVFIYGGVAVNNPFAAIVPAIFAFLINLIREVVKDMQDIEGDVKQGVITFPGKFGFRSSKPLIAELTIILILFTLYPFVIHLYKIEFIILIMALVNPLLVYNLKILFKDNSSNNLNRISSILKLNMFIGLLAILLGK
ncbi:MAG: geranylgeranylglycerol-phosphate geranylgeranyltransferase [Ignavibacteriaceae bacterium]|nr:geranylgeranylglycerol-phosphate geranylgeranyltransferase [Ignavibacteriaceae bacterium]